MSRRAKPRARRWLDSLFAHGAKRRCAYCPAELTRETATVDHVIPLAKGGRDMPSNFALSCFQCNNDKGDKRPRVRPTRNQRLGRIGP